MSALALRILACVSMLADHIGYCFAGNYPCLEYLRWFGRLSFPLFVFLLVNGFRHTSSRLRYALRLGIFALISQIPFDLFCSHPVFFEKLNVFATLLLCLLTLWAVDAMRQRKKLNCFCLLPGLLATLLCSFEVIPCDYGAKGILMALVFYFWEGKPLLMTGGVLFSLCWPRIMEATLLLMKALQGQPVAFVPTNRWELTQLLSLFSVVFLLLYRGTPGKLPSRPAARKTVQLSFYLFYPIHLVFLWLVR